MKRQRCRKCNKRRYEKYLWKTFTITKDKMEYECHNCDDDKVGRKSKFIQLKLKPL